MPAPSPRAIKIYAAAATATFVWIAWAPWLPPIDTLTLSDARVESMGGADGTAILRTENAQHLACPYSGWPGSWKCDEAALADAHAAGRSLQVRHDGQRVYHAQDGEHIIIASDWSDSTRQIAAVLALLFGGFFALQFPFVRSALNLKGSTRA